MVVIPKTSNAFAPTPSSWTLPRNAYTTSAPTRRTCRMRLTPLLLFARLLVSRSPLPTLLLRAGRRRLQRLPRLEAALLALLARPAAPQFRPPPPLLIRLRPAPAPVLLPVRALLLPLRATPLPLVLARLARPSLWSVPLSLVLLPSRQHITTPIYLHRIIQPACSIFENHRIRHAITSHRFYYSLPPFPRPSPYLSKPHTTLYPLRAIFL